MKATIPKRSGRRRHCESVKLVEESWEAESVATATRVIVPVQQAGSANSVAGSAKTWEVTSSWPLERNEGRLHRSWAAVMAGSVFRRWAMQGRRKSTSGWPTASPAATSCRMSAGIKPPSAQMEGKDIVHTSMALPQRRKQHCANHTVAPELDYIKYIPSRERRKLLHAWLLPSGILGPRWLSGSLDVNSQVAIGMV
jgi:hypothetical protein